MESILRKCFYSLILSLLYFQNRAFGSEINVPLPVLQVNLDPTKLYDQSSLWVGRHIHCQLTRKTQSEIVLEAAAKIEYLNSQELRMIIGSNFRFSDGSEILAADVIASFNFFKKFRNSYRAQFDLVSGIEAIDRKTVKFKFRDSSAKLFLSFYSTSHNPILQKSYVENYSVKDAKLKNPLGCGNYKVSEYTPGVKISLVSSFLNERKINFYFRANTEITFEELSKFDLVHLNIKDFEASSKKINADFREAKLFDPYHIVLGLNSRSENWKDRERRCALFSRLTTDSPLRSYGESALPASDLFPKGVVGFNSDQNFHSYYKAQTFSGKFSDNFCVSFVSASIPDFRQASFEHMFSTLFKAVRKLNIVNPVNFGQTFLNQNCDGIVIGFKSNNLDGADFLNVFTEETVNYSGFWSDDLKKKIIQAQTLKEISVRASAFQEISELIRNQCLIFPVLTVPYKTFYLKRSKVFPDIEKSVLNEYYLGQVNEVK